MHPDDSLCSSRTALNRCWAAPDFTALKSTNRMLALLPAQRRKKLLPQRSIPVRCSARLPIQTTQPALKCARPSPPDLHAIWDRTGFISIPPRGLFALLPDCTADVL